MVTRKSAVLTSGESAETVDLFSDAAIQAEVQRWAARKAKAEAEKKTAKSDVEYLVIKRIAPLVTKVFTKMGTVETVREILANARTEQRYQPGWQVNRLTAKSTVWASSPEEATLKAQRRALGDRHEKLDAEECAYWTNHLAQGTWGYGKYAAQAAPIKAVAVKDLSDLPVTGKIPATPDLADLDRRIAYWTKDGDKEMVKALKAQRRDVMKIIA